MKRVIGIIGGMGSMGKWFQTFFESNGIKVLISDVDTDLTNFELAKQSDIILISTPIKAALKIADEIGPILTENQLLTDICSQKEDIVAMMNSKSKSSVLGIHPMFGPFSNSITGHNIIFCEGKGDKHLSFLKSLFTDNGAVVSEIAADEHDKHMAVAQSLTHIITITMGKTLKDLGLTPDKITSLSTPIFRINTDIIGRLFAQDLHLYSTLVGDNKYFKETLDLFLNNLSNASDVLCNDHENRVAYLEDIKSFFGDFCEHGLNESNQFLKTVVSQSNF